MMPSFNGSSYSPILRPVCSLISWWQTDGCSLHTNDYKGRFDHHHEFMMFIESHKFFLVLSHAMSSLPPLQYSVDTASSLVQRDLWFCSVLLSRFDSLECRPYTERKRSKSWSHLSHQDTRKSLGRIKVTHTLGIRCEGKTGGQNQTSLVFRNKPSSCLIRRKIALKWSFSISSHQPCPCDPNGF